MLSKWLKCILLADKSDFGWKTIGKYVQDELANTEEDTSRIQSFEAWAEKGLKSFAIKKRPQASPDVSWTELEFQKFALDVKIVKFLAGDFI